MESIFGAEKKRISPWPKLVCRTSAFGMISSVIAMCGAMSLEASPSVILSFLAAAYMALVPACVSCKFYVEQKGNEGLLNCKNTEKGEFYQRVLVTSAGIAISSGVAAVVALPVGYSLGAYNTAIVACSSVLMVTCLAEGVMGISAELRDAANSKFLRREVDSLDESRGSSGLASKLSVFNIISHLKIKKNIEDTGRLQLLKDFQKDEEYKDGEYEGYYLRERIRLSSSSHTGYGSAVTTSSL